METDCLLWKDIGCYEVTGCYGSQWLLWNLSKRQLYESSVANESQWLLLKVNGCFGKSMVVMRVINCF
jgi:hypothetical protein